MKVYEPPQMGVLSGLPVVVHWEERYTVYSFGSTPPPSTVRDNTSGEPVPPVTSAVSGTGTTPRRRRTVPVGGRK